MSEAEERVIRASEIGQYVFCARAWWLGCVQGLPSSNWRDMATGEMRHRAHGSGVRLSAGLSRLAWIVLLLAIIVGLVWLTGGAGP